jgi:hypothetical protein
MLCDLSAEVFGARPSPEGMPPQPMKTRNYRQGSLLYPSNTFTMLSHSASSGSWQTGLPARLYQ